MQDQLSQQISALLRSAPGEVRTVYRSLVNNDSAGVIAQGVPLIQPLMTVDGEWAGTVAAWVGFSLVMLDDAEKAMTFCDLAEKLEYNVAGAWYALCGRMLAADALDQMEMAFLTGRKAVEVFAELESANYVNLASRRVANFAKQRCARTYRNSEMVPRIATANEWRIAKSVALEGLLSLHRAVALSGDALEEEEVEDLKALFRQAALFGVREADLAFLALDEDATAELNRHVRLTDRALSRTSVTHHWNLAIDARKAGARAVAEHYFAGLLDLDVPDTNDDDRANRGMVLYHRGVNLMLHAGLENCARVPEKKVDSARTILNSWHEFLRIYRDLPRGYAAGFQERMGFDAEQATRAVKEDRLMGFVCIELEDGMLVPLSI